MKQRIRNLKQTSYNFLRWSEKYFKTDMVYLVHGGFWLTFGQFITAGASFLLSIAFANLVPKAVYGTYRYITSIAATLTAFSLTGLGTAMVQSVARGFEGVLHSSFWLNIRWSALMVLISFAGALYYFIHGNIVLSVSMLFIGSFSPFLNSGNLATYFANGKKDFKRLSIYNIVKGILPALALIGTLFFTKNVIAIIFVYFLSNTLVALLTYFDALKTYNPNTTDDPGLLDYSKKLSILSVLGTITAHADKVLIFTSLGAVELATYSVAVAFPEQIRSALRNLNFLMVPKFAERDSSERELFLWKKIVKLSFFLVTLTIVYIVSAPFLYKLFFPKYLEAALFSQIYALSVFTALAWVPNSILVAHKRDKELFKVNTIGSVIQLVLLFTFIHLWGLWGIIAAKVIASYTNLVLSFVYVKKHYEL